MASPSSCLHLLPYRAQRASQAVAGYSAYPSIQPESLPFRLLPAASFLLLHSYHMSIEISMRRMHDATACYVEQLHVQQLHI